MSAYQARIIWQRGNAPFAGAKYSRAHEWHFDGGTVVPASASTHVVPLPYSVEAAVDPEEAFVASLSSCHMLWFLHLAAKAGHMVDAYEDDAEGTLARDERGRDAMTRVLLRPRVTFSGASIPTADAYADLHHRAHEACFIASSVRSEVVCAPEMTIRPSSP